MKKVTVKRRVPKVMSVMETRYETAYITVDGITFDNITRAQNHEKEIQKAIDYYSQLNQISRIFSLGRLKEKYYYYENHRREWLKSEYAITFLAWQYGLKTFLQGKGISII